MKRLIIFIAMSVSGFYPLYASADTDIATSVIDKAIEGGFTELEKQIIDNYFKQDEKKSVHKETDTKKKDKKKGLPPGLAKKDKLPPGLSKQLERNGTLPPGLAKRELPSDLEVELPKPGQGLERAIVDNAVVLVEKATGRIVDILRDVVTGN